ncbi:MAG: dTDP-4-amino-4,6-dideoxygalactose transaminase [Pyrinomonadaceae bacterium]|nr:dTDP-4-amino-4,6-dideoxygalactose transaminase [Pyrinomonadaceae bacterium]
MSIPFNKPFSVGTEIDYLNQCFVNEHLAGDGPFTKKCEAMLEKILDGTEKVFLTTSCTHALEMTALLLDVQMHDEVIVPSFTFPSTANAFVLRGAVPIFADVRPDTLNIDETKIERLISPLTKAIVVVHYAGIACEMDAILDIAARYNLAVIEDNAHGLFGKYKGKPLGTLGSMATQSFHETKNLSCGEGGALVINDKKFVERAEYIREKGTNRSRHFRGEIDKYSWIDIGSSYVMSELLAAFLYAQLEASEKIQTRRREIWRRYEEGLRDWAKENSVKLPFVPAHCEPAYHLFYMVLPSFKEKNGMIDYLKKENINSIFHYQPLHLSKMGRSFGGRVGDCPVTEDISNNLLRLPFYNDYTAEEQNYVIQKIKEFKVKKAVLVDYHAPVCIINFLALIINSYLQCVFQS